MSIKKDVRKKRAFVVSKEVLFVGVSLWRHACDPGSSLCSASCVAVQINTTFVVFKEIPSQGLVRLRLTSFLSRGPEEALVFSEGSFYLYILTWLDSGLGYFAWSIDELNEFY